MVIALSNGEIVYFEIDSLGHLNEYHERKEMSCPATCLAIGPIPDGRSRSKFLVRIIYPLFKSFCYLFQYFNRQ